MHAAPASLAKRWRKKRPGLCTPAELRVSPSEIKASAQATILVKGSNS
jgi:hypothetical protein